MKRLLLPLFLRIARSLGITEIQSHLHEAHTLATDAFTVAQFNEKRAANYTNEIAENLTAMLQKVQSDLVIHVDENLKRIDQEVQTDIQQFDSVLAELRQNIDSVRRAQSPGHESRIGPQSASQDTTQGTTVEIDESLYVALENRFRGKRDIVAERQSSYLGLLGDQIDSEHPLLDLGCGRGEWLGVLRDRGIPVVGVDGNSVCVAECIENQFHVVQDDILNFLSNSGDGSFGAVTLFQVFEHLPFNVLIDVLREIFRVLTPNGVLIAEIPNSKNVRVGSGTFWIDPTHQRPLFPDVLVFLAEQSGYKQVDGLYLNRLGPEHDLSGLPQGAAQALTSVLDALDGPGDFALIARR